MSTQVEDETSRMEASLDRLRGRKRIPVSSLSVASLVLVREADGGIMKYA